MFGSSPKVDVTEYRASVHFGMCVGPVDALLGVIVSEKVAWQGELTGPGALYINKPNLFGGPKKEGGAQGVIYYLPGDDEQVLPAAITARFGLTPETSPSYRGLSSVFFAGGADLANVDYSEAPGSNSAVYASSGATVYNITGGAPVADSAEDTSATGALLAIYRRTSSAVANVAKGFTWTHNTPYLPSVWLRARRIPKGLNSSLARIGDDANAAHIIYECLTNTDWGMGENTGSVDAANFNEIAQTLYDEQFGLSLLWTTQASIEDFITEILNHIQATLYVHPRTGKWTMTLLRGDYDAGTLPVFDESNSRVTSFKRRGYGEVANEITVTWTNPENEQGEGVTIQDLGAITAQGGQIISASREYRGIRNAELAATVCQRDLRSASYPLASVEAELDREGWDIVPGAVIKLSSEEDGFANVVFRVVTVNYGRVTSGAVKVSLIEDVFGLTVGEYFSVARSQWTPSTSVPEDMQFVQPFTVPAYLQPFVAEESPASPNAYVSILAAADNADTFEYQYLTEVTDGSGTVYFEDTGIRSTTSRGQLTSPLSAEAVTAWVPPPLSDGDGLLVGNIVVFGSGDDGDLEFAYLYDINDDLSDWTLYRGVMDTVPRDWPVGTPVWVFDPNTPITDDVLRAGGSALKFKLLPVTSLGVLPEGSASEHTVTVADRPYRPLRPANVKINGTAFGEVDVREAPSVTATWANRNRLTEVEAVLPWNAEGVAPEDTQTTTIEIYSLDGTLVNTIDGLTGESYTFDTYDFVGLGIALVRFTSKVGSLQSLQGHEIIVRRLSGGWNFSWGYAWGGPV